MRWNSDPRVSADNQKWAAVVVYGSSDNNRRYHLQHNSDNKNFEFVIATVLTGGTGRWVQSTTFPSTGTWNPLAGVYNKTPGIMAIYINGNQEGSRTVDSSGQRTSPGPYQVGGPEGIFWGSQGLRRFNWESRGLVIYEEALSQAEIISHAQAGIP